MDEGNEEEEKPKLDRRKKRRNVRDENLNPEAGAIVEESNKTDEKSKGELCFNYLIDFFSLDFNYLRLIVYRWN